MSVEIYPFFAFSFEFDKSCNNRNITFIFKPFGELSAIKLADFITKELLKIPIVDQLTIAVPINEGESARKIIDQERLIWTAFSRRPNAAVELVLYDSDGKFYQRDWLCNEDSGVHISEEEFSHQGVSSISHSNESILQKAPKNCIFRKPSGNDHQYFIRGSQLLGGDTQISFLTFVLLPYFNMDIHQYIYIDSMSVSPLIYKIINMKMLLSGNHDWHPQILSFHSYDGLRVAQNRPVNAEKTIVLISASSTGNMPEEIAREWKVPPKNVITLKWTPQMGQLSKVV